MNKIYSEKVFYERTNMKMISLPTKFLPVMDFEPKPLELNPELKNLADNSEKQLGYTGLKDQVKNLEIQNSEKSNRLELSKVLIDLEIEVFNSSEVFAYQKMKLEEMKRKEWRPIRWIPIPFFCFTICLSLIPIIPDINWIKGIWALSSALSFIALWFVTPAVLSDCRDEANLWQWRKVDLKDYKKPVPEFVLHKALQIKGRYPLVSFTIHELVKREKQIDADPFIAVCIGERGYFFEVWDEPKFETKL